MQAPYIPPKDADLVSWAQNFADLISATPATYGLTSANALTISAANDAWQLAYATAINPPTRTKPSVADKDAAKAAFLGIARPFAILVRNNQGVSNMDKLDLGLNVPDQTPTPIPVPTSSPGMVFVAATPLQHTLRFNDSNNPTLRGKKPDGAIGIEIYRTVGLAPTTDPDDAVYVGSYTQNPIAVDYQNADRTKYATYFGRFVIRARPVGTAGAAPRGPWSDPLAAVIV